MSVSSGQGVIPYRWLKSTTLLSSVGWFGEIPKPTVKVQTEEDVFLCMVCPVAMLWGFFYFPFIASRQNLCEELFLKIQNKFLGGFLIMEAINNVQNKTRFTPK